MELAFVFPDEIITICLVDGDFQQAGGEDRPPTGSLCSLIIWLCINVKVQSESLQPMK